jgi:RNA polymerase sigma-70 factor (ECF subfamily)
MVGMTSEDELVQRVKNGDRAAFDQLYELYKRPIANLLYRLCFDRELVNDLLQEVFVRFWRGLPGFRGGSKLLTFIYRIAYNVWINEQRHRRERTSPGAEKVAHGDPAEAAFQSERLEAVKEAIKTLPPNERVILVMSEYNDLPYEQISEILGIPVGTVKSRMFYALQHLRERLKGKV